VSERQARRYARALPTVFGRGLRKRDGVSALRLRKAEERLGFKLPGALREFYGLAGAARETRRHNWLYEPEDLVVEQRYLVFMDENQSVVQWGIPVRLLRRTDPGVWQRVNGDRPQWYSERMVFSEFMLKNLAWQLGTQLSAV
jgi:hypothetical protein